MSAQQPQHPLTDTHLVQINNALQTLQLAQNQVDLAKRAGIDVSSHQATIDDNRTKLLAIKNTYFPGR
jgi:hypothetical protein